MSEKFVLKNLKSKHFGGASCVVDSSMLAAAYKFINAACTNDCLNNTDIQEEFLSAYKKWIDSTELNNLKNLDKFPIAAYSNGTSESFDKFYMKNNKRRFRCFRGEYMYHMATWRNICPDWRYMEEAPLAAGDAVVISLPFSDTGNIHPETQHVLDQCNRLAIPVLIDCAFIGICSGIEFDFDQPCITDITFSLSKTFPVANLRIGMRLTRTDDDDSLLVHGKTNYTNRLGAAVGLMLMEIYSMDYNYNMWHSMQEKFCNELGIMPSRSVIFGIASDKFQEYNRGGATNRLCFAKWLSGGQLPND
jgi:hypothetical protein